MTADRCEPCQDLDAAMTRLEEAMSGSRLFGSMSPAWQKQTGRLLRKYGRPRPR
jgi:hypothetical protein